MKRFLAFVLLLIPVMAIAEDNAPAADNDSISSIVEKMIDKKIEEELTYPGQIKVHVLRETKAIEYAK